MIEESLRRKIAKLNEEFGPQICAALKSSDVVEIMLNECGRIFVERLGGDISVEGHLDADRIERIIGNVAHCCGTVIDQKNPILSGELPDCGSRFQGMLPPISPKPVFSIRRKALSIYTLQDYVRDGVMLASDALVLRTAVAERKNIVIVGGTGSGKTTLANAIIQEISQISAKDRIIIIEDTVEIQCASTNKVQLRTSDYVDMNQLVKSTMRMRPDRIIVGEVRDGAALSLLKAWNTGHPGGVATIHANSAYDGLIRLEQLVSEVSQTPMQQLIAASVDVLVFIERSAGKRRVAEIIEVSSFSANQYQTHSLRPSSQKEITHAT